VTQGGAALDGHNKPDDVRCGKIKIFVLFAVAVLKRNIISSLDFFLVLLRREKADVDILVLGVQKFGLVATLTIK
jgi:hypothetical protein